MIKSGQTPAWTSPTYIERERHIAIARELQKIAVKKLISALLSKAKEKLWPTKRRFAPVSPAT